MTDGNIGMRSSHVSFMIPGMRVEGGDFTKGKGSRQVPSGKGGPERARLLGTTLRCLGRSARVGGGRVGKAACSEGDRSRSRPLGKAACPGLETSPSGKNDLANGRTCHSGGGRHIGSTHSARDISEGGPEHSARDISEGGPEDESESECGEGARFSNIPCVTTLG